MPRVEGRIREGAVVDFDEIDAVAQSAAQGAFAQRPIVRRAELQVIAAGGEVVEPNVVDDVGEGPGTIAFHGQSQRRKEKGKR
jgi:hypothetical protein